MAMATGSHAPGSEAPGFFKMTGPIVMAVFAVYLSIGITLGALPSFIKKDLAYSSFTVGLVIGLQALATLLTRAYAGKRTDVKGAKNSKQIGVLLVLVAGVLYVAAGLLSAFHSLALAVLVLSRVIHGVAESMLVTGALAWGIGLVGHGKSGKVMTWNGIAMYAGIAIGAPLSIWLVNTSGVVSAFAVILVLALFSWMATAKLPAIALEATQVRTPFYKVIGLVAEQGMALAFSSMGFACIASFVALLFAENNWQQASLGFLCFGGFYVLTRVFFASFPDKYGGYKVALVSFIIEIAGQLLIAFAPDGITAIAGCALTGIGFSLVFPSLGVLAIKKVTPQMRGTALGAYAAFFDLSLGLAGPIAGIIAGWFNYQAIYLFGAISCLLALLLLVFKNTKA
ncbi:MFS transporter [Filimonas lacunae]|nr:MFS transporter [Filimonas lacunae]BAV07083.1 transport protein [Filimonas lacunae]